MHGTLDNVTLSGSIYTGVALCRGLETELPCDQFTLLRRVNRKAALHSWSVSEKGIFPVHRVRNMNAPKAGEVKGRWIRQLDNFFLHWTVQTWETKDLFRDAGLADDDGPPAPWTVASMADAEAGICARVVRETSKMSICRSLGWRVVVNWSLWDSCAGRNLEREALPRRSWGGCPGKLL